MRLIDEIADEAQLYESALKVISNKGAPGIDKMSVDYVKENIITIVSELSELIRNKTYEPVAVRRVYIPKANGKQRPLGIPIVLDRIVQQSLGMTLSRIYEPLFSNSSFGFRPQRNCHMAIYQALDYLNEGYEWIVDLDIEKFFDTVNHDKLISILREQVNEKETLNLVRKFLKAGVMEQGKVEITEEGVPQGGPVSPILANIYLDKLDKELESRGLRFSRYADDVIILARSQMAAERIIKTVSSWLERKLFLKVSATKSKVVRPSNGSFLGFGFWFDTKEKRWTVKPLEDRKKRLVEKVKKELIRKYAVAKGLKAVFTKLNQIIRGWINYYAIGMMKMFMEKFGEHLRTKVRVVILKSWKKRTTIYGSLCQLKRMFKFKEDTKLLWNLANARAGWFPMARYRTITKFLSKNILARSQDERPGLVIPEEYYEGMKKHLENVRKEKYVNVAPGT